MASINGQEYQHALIDLQATGGSGAPFRFSRFKSLKYEDGAEKTGVTNSQGQLVSYVIKPQKTDGSMSMLFSEWILSGLRDWLRQQAATMSAQLQRPVGIGQVAFDLTVQYGNTIQTKKTDRLLGVMIQKEPRDSSDTQEALVVEIPLFVLKIADDQGNSFISYQ